LADRFDPSFAIFYEKGAISNFSFETAPFVFLLFQLEIGVCHESKEEVQWVKTIAHMPILFHLL